MEDLSGWRLMYGSLFLCIILLTSVAVEMILRSLLHIIDPKAELPDDDSGVTGMARAD